MTVALAADTVSILVMEVVDNVVLLTVPGAMRAGLLDALFWASLAFSLVVASCWLTVWLLGRAGGDIEWLAWGGGESFVPQVAGLHRLASLIAGFWGVCLVVLFLGVLVRRVGDTAGEGKAAPEPRSSTPNGPRPLTAPRGVRQ